MAGRMNRVLSSWILERKVIGDRIRLNVGITAIGRMPGTALCILDSQYVSRKHAEIIVDEHEKIVLRDLDSANGTFVNGTKIKNESIALNANDCIGIGVTDDFEPDLKHPIYKLIYAPMQRAASIDQDHVRNDEQQIMNYPLPANARPDNQKILEKETDGDASISSAKSSPSTSTINQMESKCETVARSNNIDSAISGIDIISATTPKTSGDLNQLPISGIRHKVVDSLPPAATAAKKSEQISPNVKCAPSLSNAPTLFSGAIIIVSDDEDDVINLIKEENIQSQIANKSECIQNAQSSDQEICNKSNEVPPNKSSSTKDTISMLQAPNDAAIHEPILPEVKREFIRSCTENVVEIFGRADDIILDSVKGISPLVYTTLNGRNSNKMLYDGDSIDLLSDNEDDGANIAEYVESFGKLVPEIGEKQNSTKTKENIAVNNILLDNSLNSSKNNGDEQKGLNVGQASVSGENQDVEIKTEKSTKMPEEPAEFVDIDDDMWFSQILINDIKSEMMADNNESDLPAEDDAPDDDMTKNDGQDNLLDVFIKKEIIDNDLSNPVSITAKQESKSADIENDVWITIDDDEEFEHQVSDWSTKLLSQKMNMSQVFELQSDKQQDLDENNPNAGKEGNLKLDCNSEDFDEFFNEALVDDVIETLAKKNGEIKNETRAPSLERQLSSDSDSNNDFERNKELLPKREEVKIHVNYSGAATERKASPALTGAPEDLKAGISSKSFRRLEKDLNSDSKESITSKEKVELRKDLIKPVKRLHHPPSIIEAPNLPKHKGKHRGVSAESRPTAVCTNNIRKKAIAVSGQLKDEGYREELKRKWFEKPADERRREKEKRRVIQESRKERLKELAGKQSAGSAKELLKRKHDAEHESGEKKKAKVKITTRNRGALLAEDIGAVKKNIGSYKIPKIKQCSSGITNAHREPPITDTATTTKPNHSTVVDAFAQEMRKLDKIISRRFSTSSSSKTVSSVEENKNENTLEETKINAPVRRINKITFASMQKNFAETRKNQELLQKFAINRSCLIDVVHRNANKERQKKRVRFNDTPIVHLIERINGANKRVDRKDILPSPTCADRAHMIRSAYKMIDQTAEIISKILGWSNEWLVNRNAHVDAASDIVLPMPNQFTTFNHYKSIITPLMKLEFISVLEREKNRCKSKTFIISAEQVTPSTDRFRIMGRYAGVNNSGSKSELVVLEWGKFTAFAYMSGRRLGFNTTTVVYDVLAEGLLLEELRSCLNTPMKVRPMIDIVRVEVGAFNAVFQLEQSPLLNQILDPRELCKLKPLPKCDIQYNGCDDLNDRQKDVLFRTYRRAIEPTPNITLIQGPPGTGKSCVIGNLVHQLLYGNEVRILDQKILVCAQSNAAVDVIAEKLYIMSQKKLPEVMFRLIRFGLMERISPKVHHATLPKIIERNQIRKLKMSHKNLQIDDKVHIKEYLRNEIVQLEAAIEVMKLKNVKGTVQEEELLEKTRQVQLMQNIVNGVLRPEDERSLYNWHLKHAHVVCTTLSSCVKLSQYINYFDVCIIDEATQCTEPWTLMPLKFGINALVLVGDTQQLPATVLSKKASDFGLGTSLFTRIQRCIESVNLKNVPNGLNAHEKTSVSNKNDIIFSLRTQYRMHPEICKWPNSYFYKNQLIDDPKTHKFKPVLKPFSILNLTYTQDENCLRGQIVNELEAKFVARFVKTLDGYIPMKYNTYGVITPYAQQRGALEKALRTSGFTNVMVNTIDSYQGMERDVIIISNARTNGIGFLANYQRLNVALTRPKKCLILCGNFKNLETVPAWRSLLAAARERKLYHELSADCMDDMHRNVIPRIKISKAAAATEVAAATTSKELTVVAGTSNQAR
ncbi:uncharacterized protein LOC128859941 isoform X1 [Anastrepha ludens]|uniref:uncharacterized protein LOC128859941 isoform X1 n=1 Tax=Anastrepha ludens TaxID=28586 RepID=UPI0023AFBC66|nr:uncharacterized protein LOC128859941 isoform X1 [Anastrepha ludens]